MDEKRHSIRLDEREVLNIEGVLGVDTTVEQRVSLHTTMGDLVILGENLHIRHLNLTEGTAEFGGKINSFTYPEKYLRNKGKKQTDIKRNHLFRG